MQTPAIKGAAIQNMLRDVREMRRNGTISEEELGKRLQRKDFAVLDEDVDPYAWVPIQTYGRLCDLLMELDGKGSEDYLRKRGADVADSFIQTGIYEQINSLKRQDSTFDTVAEFRRYVKQVVTVHQLIFNFSLWTVKLDPDHRNRIQIEVGEAVAFPDVWPLVTEGFLTRCSEIAGSSIQWISERPSRERILFRMTSNFQD